MALLDQVSATKGTLLPSSVQRVTATGSASGEWVGVLQVLGLERDGSAYEHVQFIVPIADREYTIGVTSAPGSSDANAYIAGYIAATLVP